MSQSEKPPIRYSTPPEVDVELPGSDAIGEHRNDIFFAAIETTRMPMLVTDPRQPDNPIVFVNRAFLSMSGYSHEEVIGHNCRFLTGAGTEPWLTEMLRTGIRRRQPGRATHTLLDPDSIAKTYWELHCQGPTAWTQELDLRPAVEKF